MTLKVYKDNKWTVSANSPTLMNPQDPIYDVAPSALSGQYNFKDPLKINADVTANKTVNMFDFRYKDPELKEENPEYYDPFAGW
jgi:hypothetical protein